MANSGCPSFERQTGSSESNLLFSGHLVYSTMPLLVPRTKLATASVSCYIMYLRLVLAAVHMKLAIKNLGSLGQQHPGPFSLLLASRPRDPAVLIPRGGYQFVFGGETTLNECKTMIASL